MKRQMGRIAALILALVMMGCMIPVHAAEEQDAANAVAADEYVVEENALAETAAEDAVAEEAASAELEVDELAAEEAAEEVAVEEIAPEELVVEEPVDEEAAAEETAPEEPAAEEPVNTGLAAEELAAEETATEEPALAESEVEDPAAEEPAAVDLEAEEPAPAETAAEESAVEETMDDETVSAEPEKETMAEEIASADPAAEGVATEETAAEEMAPAEEPAAEPTAEEPVVEVPATEEDAAEEAVAEPATDLAPADTDEEELLISEQIEILNSIFPNPDVLSINGFCGVTASFNLNYEGKLTISGTGVVEDNSGWERYKESVISVTIGEGITEIADYCFQGCSSLPIVAIPSTMTRIGAGAFTGSMITDVNYSGTMEQWTEIQIGDNAGLANAIIRCSDGDIDPSQYAAVTFDANGGTFYAKDANGEAGEAIGSTMVKYFTKGSDAFLFQEGYDVQMGQVLYYTSSLPDAVVQRPGYLLTGWVIEETGETYPRDYYSGGMYGNSAYLANLTENRTVKAVWEEEVTITLDYNGGTDSEGRTGQVLQCAKSWMLYVVTEGYYIGRYVLPIPEKESCGLTGWILEDGTIFVQDQYIMTTSDHTLTAKWGEEVTVTVSPGDKAFDTEWRYWSNNMKNGFGEDGKARFTAYGGSQFNDVQKISYYWPTSADGAYYATAWKIVGDPSGRVIAHGEKFTLPEADTVLEAVWSKKVRVDYDYDGGTCNPGIPSTSAYENTAATSTYVIFQYNIDSGHMWVEEAMRKEGYVFGGWKVKGSADGQIYHAGDTYDLQEDTTFIAVWEIDPNALNGWQVIDGKYYYYKNGVAQKGIVKIGSNYYFFNKSTGALQVGFVNEGGKYYYFDKKSGAMKTGFVSDNGYYYFSKKDGTMQFGIVQDGTSFYYFDKSSGKLKTGVVQEGTKYYYFHTTSGKMQFGFVNIGGKYYYFSKTNGSMQFGFVQDGGKYYYFSPTNGAMQTGWVKYGGYWFYFNPTNGAMVTGTQVINGKTYRFNSNGVCIG